MKRYRKPMCRTRFARPSRVFCNVSLPEEPTAYLVATQGHQFRQQEQIPQIKTAPRLPQQAQGPDSSRSLAGGWDKLSLAAGFQNGLNLVLPRGTGLFEFRTLFGVLAVPFPQDSCLIEHTVDAALAGVDDVLLDHHLNGETVAFLGMRAVKDDDGFLLSLTKKTCD
jgi:hypothetical protein